MNDYEQKRLENIQRNQDLLKDLELSKDLIKPPAGPVRTSRSKGVRKSTKNIQNPPLPTRSSARLANTSRPGYDDDKSRGLLPERTASPVRPPKPSRGRSQKSVEKSMAKLPASNLSVPQSVVASWKWAPTAPPPTRDDDGWLSFKDFPDFNPNMTPEEIIRAGCFGGTYFRPLYSKKLDAVVRDDYEELPTPWISDVDIEKCLTSETYDASVNKYGVACGQSIEEWEAQGWIDHRFDVRGWFQWYTRFYQGRRCEDDERQISRWKKCCGETGRWRRTLLKRYGQAAVKTVEVPSAEGLGGMTVTPVIHQTCLHWAFEMTQKVLDEYWASLG